MKKTNWNEYEFRCSQIYKIMTGSITFPENYSKEIKELTEERDKGVNKNGNKVKWTTTKKEKLESLISKKNKPWHELLPQTMKTELRKIFRAEKYNRTFSFTNKFVQKGISQEEDGITTLQNYRNYILKLRTYFVKNKKRKHNGYVSGESDLTDTNDFNNCKEGFDIKCSWELDTFPFKEDALDFNYELQNQGYMWLSGANKWTTCYVLANITEDLLHKEKMKWFYPMGSPTSKEDSNYDNYIEKCKELEIKLIFDYDRFVEKNPFHDLEIKKQDWVYDIPLKDRVIEKVSYYNQDTIDKIKHRIEISRKYLKYLEDTIS
tara:strand:- start:2122 stop:3081 length:960 start_codon:yes stop_codon:yes gene_type:complete